MNQRPLVVACVFALLIPSGTSAQTLKTNAPGNVTSLAGPLRLKGHFEIREASSGEPAIMSEGNGGACLVAQLPAKKTCNDASPCPAGAKNYCVKENPTDLGGTCWVQPPTYEGVANGDPCLKRVTVGPHDTPFYNASAFARETGARDWRVLACLNGTLGQCADTAGVAVEGVTMLHRAGPIAHIELFKPPFYARGWGPFPLFVWFAIAFAAILPLAYVVKKVQRNR
jgi:hypothetical protein